MSILVIDASLVERERHIALDLEDLCKTLLETTSVLDKIGNVAHGQGVVQHLQEDLVQEGEEVALDQVPDHWAQEVEDVVDGLSKVTTPNQVVEVDGDVGEICGNVHLCDLNKAISVDQDSGFSMKGDTIELKVHRAISIDGEDAECSPVQGICCVSPEISNRQVELQTKSLEVKMGKLGLKSGKVLDDKVIDGDVEIDRNRIVDIDWVDVKVRHFKWVERRDAQVRNAGWHLSLEELEDGGDVLVHGRVSQSLALPEGGEGEKSEHNPHLHFLPGSVSH